MRRGIGLLVLAVLPLGCAATAPPAPVPPEARGSAAAAGPSGSRAVPSPVLPSPPPPPPSVPPQVSPRIDNEEQAVRDVNVRLARAGQVVAQLDPSKLGQEQREMLSGLQDFISKAVDALQARDVPRAQILADKASRLADDLIVAVKNSRPRR